KWMRKFRGAHVYAVVTLSDTFMNTKFGGRQRPHFLIKRWIILGGDGGEPVAQVVPPTLPSPGDAAKPASVNEALEQFAKPKTVEPPTLKESMGCDEGTC